VAMRHQLGSHGLGSLLTMDDKSLTQDEIDEMVADLILFMLAQPDRAVRLAECCAPDCPICNVLRIKLAERGFQ
jgi:hypothetical protein